jgi:hypothetical protein
LLGYDVFEDYGDYKKSYAGSDCDVIPWRIVRRRSYAEGIRKTAAEVWGNGYGRRSAVGEAYGVWADGGDYDF